VPTKQGFVKKYIRDSVGKYSHTPDAVFALEKEGNAALFFLEIDRGIEVVSDPEKGLLKAVVFPRQAAGEGCETVVMPSRYQLFVSLETPDQCREPCAAGAFPIIWLFLYPMEPVLTT
jgi:hypothetical protein